jgi:hypothetical protein
MNRVQNLSVDEEQVLRGYLAQGVRTRKFLPSDGAITLLVHDRILAQSSRYGDLIEGFPYTLTDWAWRYLLEHPECVGISKQDLKRILRG